MAALTADQLAAFRALACRNAATQTWTKAQIGAALQAIEDRVRSTATQNAIGGDIETAAPGVFTGPQKTLLFGVWCVTAAQRLGILS